MVSAREFSDDPDRRASPRYRWGEKAACQLTEMTNGHHWEAAIHDISAEGISVVVGRHFPSASLLTLELGSPTGTCLCSLLVRVVHSRQQPGGDWLLGCVLASKFSEEELRGLVHHN